MILCFILVNISSDAAWAQSGVTIVDFTNNRIIQWKKGDTIRQVFAFGKSAGNGLNIPTDVLVDEETDSRIVSDSNNRRVVR